MSSPLEDTVPASSGPQPTRPRDGLVPLRISRFEIERKLGEGGNGVVWLARDPMLERNVAIKVLQSHDNAAASHRLVREAQSAAKVVHENIIVIHEVGLFEERVYVAMEYVAGASLGRWQRGRSWHEIVTCYLRAGQGVAAAHAAGLVHRDFKPDNVLVGDDRRVRVTDFGLVSVAGMEVGSTEGLAVEARGDTLGMTLTRTGEIMGTPRYMAPEQHEGAAIDARTDQFAYCAALYEALFGRPAFAGDSYSELARNVCDGAVRPPPADSDVPAGIRDAIVRGLSRQRDDRFASMTELLDVVASLLPAAAPPVARDRARWRWRLIGMGLCLVIAAVLAWQFYRRPVRDTDPGTVEAAYRAGEAAYIRGDYKTAVDHFKRGFALAPDIGEHALPYLYNLGAAYRQMGNCKEAALAFRKYEALSGELPENERTLLARMIPELEACAAKQP